jgi:hypothetical protein
VNGLQIGGHAFGSHRLEMRRHLAEIRIWKIEAAARAVKEIGCDGGVAFVTEPVCDPADMTVDAKGFLQNDDKGERTFAGRRCYIQIDFGAVGNGSSVELVINHVKV